MTENTVEYRGQEYNERELDALFVQYLKTAFTVLIGAAAFYQIGTGDFWAAYSILAAGVTLYYIGRAVWIVVLADELNDEDEVEDE